MYIVAVMIKRKMEIMMRYRERSRKADDIDDITAV
jgi:hypothetical protein